MFVDILSVFWYKVNTDCTLSVDFDRMAQNNKLKHGDGIYPATIMSNKVIFSLVSLSGMVESPCL